MVIAHHLVWTVYGTWLPNDPRGSGSREVISAELVDLGELHYGRRKTQSRRKVVREFYDCAEPKLLFQVVRFTPQQFGDVAKTFGDVIRQCGYTCYASAIMPDHLHLVIRKHRELAETMIEKLQSITRECLGRLTSASPEHPIWTDGGWKRFLNSPRAVRDAIRYVENNPLEIGLPRQSWPFVKEYDDWPFQKRSG